MKKPTVRLKIRIRLSDNSRAFAEPVFSQNRKLKPLYAVVGGNPEHHPEGVYFLRYLKGEKRVWESVGPDPQLALVAKIKRERYIEAKASGVAVIDERPSTPTRATNESVAEYLADVRENKSHKTYLGYSLALKLFLQSYTKPLDQLERRDVLKYIANLRAIKLAPCSIANRVRDLKVFVRNQGVTWPMLKSDKVRFTEKAVSPYSREMIADLMASAGGDEGDLFQFFLCTGAREQEVEFATWADIDFDERVFRISEKLDLGFTPKDKEEGVIPIPDSLVERLRKRKAANPRSRLIFPHPSGKPNGHFLRVLKERALRAGLNCGCCYNKQQRCCAEHPVCKQWGLHRFRKTFATWHHENGVPVRTIQRWLRHSSLDTTLKYLASSESKSQRTRERVNSTFADIVGADRRPALCPLRGAGSPTGCHGLVRSDGV